ncbi:MAG: hypothetical protein ACI89G_002367, partial [Minisyncoccia bacterium]
MTALDTPPVSEANSNDAERIIVVQKSATIGAMVSGVDLSSTLSDTAIGVIRQAL